jgi:putative thiamine transport system ATP-binding protein
MSLVIDDLEIALAGRSLVTAPRLEVAAGEVLTVMGPSGSGKSTLLAWLSGALDPAFTARGRVLLDGQDVSRLMPARRRIGLLFQDDLLFPHLSVAENLAFGLPAEVRSRAARRARIDQALEEAELAGFGPRDPATLSGGQRARVALLRTLLAEPRALLLDEPFSKLDVALRGRMRGFVFERVRRLRIPVLLVTHDPADATAADGYVLELVDGRLMRAEAPAASDHDQGVVGVAPDRVGPDR